MKHFGVVLITLAVLAMAPPASALALPVTYRVDTKEPVVFITIDDGIVASRAALDYVEKRRIPITSFLTSSQVTAGKARYFARISHWGSVQNHTTSHASLETTDESLITSQVCPVQASFRRTFGAKPWMLRPPYGAGPSGATLHHVARRCGISDIVMWDTVVEGGQISYRFGDGLQPGSVILLHYSPSLATDLRIAVRAARARGLRPASLADYLLDPGGRRAPGGQSM